MSGKYWGLNKTFDNIFKEYYNHYLGFGVSEMRLYKKGDKVKIINKGAGGFLGSTHEVTKDQEKGSQFVYTTVGTWFPSSLELVEEDGPEKFTLGKPVYFEMGGTIGKRAGAPVVTAQEALDRQNKCHCDFKTVVLVKGCQCGGV